MAAVQDATNMDTARVWKILETVSDPEIPVLTVVDLGIIRDVQVDEADSCGGENGKVHVTLTPTYSGCPAIDVIGFSVREALSRHGYTPELHTVLTPAWSTDWISDAGRRKLRAYGIAPPAKAAGKGQLLGLDPVVACPRCGAEDTEKISEFGSTACKAFYRCRSCLEPFDYFKCI